MAAKVGLTGGIGCGKSSVARAFAAQGVTVIEADDIARELTAAGGEHLPPIVAQFGAEILCEDGELDRRRLGRIVFADAAKRGWLEQHLHPPIRAAMESRARDCGDAYCICVVPLLIETGQHRQMQRVLHVHCARETRIERVVRARGVTRDEVLAVMQAQLSDAERRQFADDEIDNNAAPEALHAQVAQLHQKYLAMFGDS